MTLLAGKKRRERTNTNRKRAAQIFDTPGVYQPVFGKTSIYIFGHGQPGNAPYNSNVANYNPSTPGTVSGTNPIIPGNYAGTNPSTPGTYAGTNSPTGGNISYYNPDGGGNVAGYNPTVPGNQSYNPPVPGQIVHTFVSASDGNTVTSYYYISGYFTISPYTSYNPANQWYTRVNVDRPPAYYVPGNSYYNPSTGGTPNYNPTIPGNAVYSPYVPGNAYYNSPTPGNAYYNPPTGGNANYNAPIPGNANYNTYVAGTPGVPFSVLGVNFPGGEVASSAPLVGRTLTYAPYLGPNTGYPVNVQPGGTVTIEET